MCSLQNVFSIGKCITRGVQARGKKTVSTRATVLSVLLVGSKHREKKIGTASALASGYRRHVPVLLMCC